MQFRVLGIPKAQPRARAFARKMGGKFVARVYDAGTAESWKSMVVTCGNAVRPQVPLEGPLRVDITFLMPRPARLRKKKSPPGRIWFASKPDRDNLDKAVLDAMTQTGWWIDDAQVVSGMVQKVYCAVDEAPGAIIAVRQLLDSEVA